MDRPLIILRPAKPTHEEGLVFARYMDEAAEGFIRFMLGRRYAEIVAEAFTHPENNYSFQNVIFAEHDNTIVGMASGFTGEQHRRFTDEPLKRANGYPSLRMAVIKALLAPLMRILNTIDEDDFYILSIAIDKELRGKGIGSQLIKSMEDRAIVAHSARLSLDVAANNDNARRLYEHLGMTVDSRWPKRIKMPGLKLFRMAKPLDEDQ